MLVNSGLLQIIEILYKTLEWDLGSTVVYLQSVVTFDQVLIENVCSLTVYWIEQRNFKRNCSVYQWCMEWKLLHHICIVELEDYFAFVIKVF